MSQFRTQIGPNVVYDNSLIFYYDMENTDRSFKGKPSTNLLDQINNMNNAVWEKSGTIEFDDVFAVPEQTVTITTTGTSARYWLNNSSVTSGVTYTQSVYLKPNGVYHFQMAPSTGFNNDHVNFQLTEEGDIGGPLASDATIELVKAGRYQGWYRCTLTDVSNFTTTSGRIVFALADSLSTSRLANVAGTAGQGIIMLDPQFEASSFATPFVNGTRSSSDVIVDLTGTYTPSATSLTYNSDGTFSFSGATANGGTQDRVTVGIGSYPTAWTDPFSIEAWFKIPSGADWQDEVSFGNNSGTGIVSRGGYGGAIGLWTSDTSNIRFVVRSANTQYGHTEAAQYDVWYHLVGTHDGGTTNALKTYVNGDLVGTNSFTNNGDAPDQQNWIVGGNNALGGTNGGFFEGDIPIVRLYSKALSAAEVKQNFNAQRGRFGL